MLLKMKNYSVTKINTVYIYLYKNYDMIIIIKFDTNKTKIF